MQVRAFVSAFVTLAVALPAFAADALPRATPESVGMSSARLARIGETLRADVEKGRIPGAVVAIARKGKLVYFEAFGYLDKDAGTKMTTDAIFSIASMTKPLTGVAALTLYEDGKVLIKTLYAGTPYLDAPIRSIELLDGGKISWQQTPQGLKVSLPLAVDGSFPYALRIRTH